MRIANISVIEDEQDYYDLTISDTHNFLLSNGSIVHNCGTGQGFSVERQYVIQMPVIAEEFFDTQTVLVVADSRTGWCRSFKELIGLLYNGQIPKWDLSKLRPEGAKLKTFGGRASGPKPLDELFKFCVTAFKNAAGRKLNSLEVHDIVCKIGEVVVVGGVRRSALISLSNLSDQRMRAAKAGSFWVDNPQRSLSNNSVCYTETPDTGIFLDEWKSLYQSKTGERGIFNRAAAQRKIEQGGNRDPNYDFGLNPCSEIFLRDRGLCNLSEVIIRAHDTYADIERKVTIATIIGTIQSTLIDFKFLSSKWRENAEEERLLGVSMTGIMDHPVLSGTVAKFNNGYSLSKALDKLRMHARVINAQFAKALGINPSAAITTVKPSGTVSQLVDSSSGIHPRYSRHYIRNVRQDIKDPISQMLIDQGVPYAPDVVNANSLVFSFPIATLNGSVLRNDITALQQANHSKTFADHWCEHNPSITVYVREREWLAVGAWVYDNFNTINGMSFLPHTDHVYKQAPYEEVDKDAYEKAASSHPVIDWSALVEYESSDMTIGSQELACSAGICDI